MISKQGKTKRGLSRINNALRLYLRNQGVVVQEITYFVDDVTLPTDQMVQGRSTPGEIHTI